MVCVHRGAQISPAEGQQGAQALAQPDASACLGDGPLSTSDPTDQPKPLDQDHDALAATGSIDRILHVEGECDPAEEGQNDHAACLRPLDAP